MRLFQTRKEGVAQPAVGWRNTFQELELDYETRYDCRLPSVFHIPPGENPRFARRAGNPTNKVRRLSFRLLVVLPLTLMVWLSGSAAAETNITFPDPNTEIAIRQTLGKSTGSVTSLDLSMLTELYAYDANITNLSGLEWATNLTTLYLGGNSISDLTALQNLKHLNSLFLYNNLIHDLSPLSGLTNLSNLDLRWNPITNYDTALAGLSNLTTLYLAGSSVTNLVFLTNLTQMTYFGLNNSGVTSLSPIIALTNLSGLDLSYNPLADFAPLGELPALADLYLSGNSISNLTVIQNLTQLTSLTVYSNRIDSLLPLAELTNLSLLRLERNQVNDNTVPPSLTNLIELNLSQNSISNLTFVTNLSQLTSLLICNNFISDLSPLIGLTNLNYLDLSWNPTSNHEAALAGLTNLASLHMSGNSIGDLTFLTNLTHLAALGLATNSISDVSPLNGLTNLNSLNLQQNRLADIEPLRDLPQLSYLNVRLNLLDLSTNAPTEETVTNLLDRGAIVDYLPQRKSPFIAVGAHWYIPANATSSLPFRISDNGPFSQQLTVTAGSSDSGLVTDANLVVARTTNESGMDWTITATPTTGQTGTAMITLTATNDVGLSTNVTVILTVLTPQTVALGDPKLEAVIRRTLAKPTGDLTSLDLLTLTDLYAYNADITDLSGLAWAQNLTSLALVNNSISDLSTLASLTNLNYLDLSGNPITNYDSTLTGLANLTSLYLGGSSISNLTFLTNLTHLTKLGLIANQISDVSPLATLTNLHSLYLQQNRLTDIAPLIDLPRLSYANVRLNLLDLSTNSPASATIASLQSRGGHVEYLPQREPPVFAASAHWYIAANTTSSLPFGVSDNAAYGSQIVVTATSSNPGLVPDVNLMAGQDADSYWMLTVTPTADQTGTTTVTLTATNGAGLSTNITVQLTVVAMTPQVVVVTDPTLQGLVRSALVKPTGNLTSLDLLALTALTAHNANITDLSGLEWAANLTTLGLGGNTISNLVSLTNLTQLTSLTLFNNIIADLSPLAGLTNLHSLYLRQNRLKDIEGLLNLPALSYVDVRLNLLEVTAGSPTMTIIASLQARGVTVDFLPQREPPNIAVSTHWYIPANTTSSLPFGVSDNAAYGSHIGVTASSSNPDLVPDTGLVVSQDAGSYRMLTVTPATDQTGTTTITLTATNGPGLSNHVTMELTVVAATPQAVAFGDPKLESILRSTLVRPTGILTSFDLLALTTLYAPSAQITNLSGLEWAVNLTSLTLFNNRITDLSPLAGLTNLNALYLRQNRLSDISPLTELPQLASVDIRLNLLDLGTDAPALTVITNLQGRGVTVDHLPQREPPVLAIRANWVIAADKTSWLPFDVSDNTAYASQIDVTASSSNAALLPDANLVVDRVPSELGIDWAVIVKPITNQTGTTTITLTATNDVGLGTNVMIVVTVAMPLALNNDLLDGTNFTWLTGGDAPWFGQNYISRDGVSAAQSGSILNGQESWVETTVSGPGILTFWWKVSSEANYDWLEFYTTGVAQTNRISGVVDWRQEVVNIPPGVQTLGWRYAKDPSDSTGLDTAWLDQVSFVPMSWLERVAAPTNGQFQLVLHPLPGRLYELQASTNLMHWFPLTLVTATNTSIPYLDVAAHSLTRFYRLYELPAGWVWLDQPKLVDNEIHLVLRSQPGLKLEMQASTDLVGWSGLAAFTNTLGTVTYTNTLDANLPARYFRALVLP